MNTDTNNESEMSKRQIQNTQVSKAQTNQYLATLRKFVSKPSHSATIVKLN